MDEGKRRETQSKAAWYFGRFEESRASKQERKKKRLWCCQCCFALGITPFGGRKSFSRGSGRKDRKEAVSVIAADPQEKTRSGQDTHAATRNLPLWWERPPPIHPTILYVPYRHPGLLITWTSFPCSSRMDDSHIV